MFSDKWACIVNVGGRFLEWLFFLSAGHKDSVSNVSFSHDGTLLATGDLSGLIQVLKLADGTVIWTGEADADLEVINHSDEMEVI